MHVTFPPNNLISAGSVVADFTPVNSGSNTPHAEIFDFDEFLNAVF